MQYVGNSNKYINENISYSICIKICTINSICIKISIIIKNSIC